MCRYIGLYVVFKNVLNERFRIVCRFSEDIALSEFPKINFAIFQCRSPLFPPIPPFVDVLQYRSIQYAYIYGLNPSIVRFSHVVQ